MRGLYGAPYAACLQATASRTLGGRSHLTDALFRGCTAAAQALSQPADRYAPTIRIQDELHLLRDSLGAVDAHYEALLDHLQRPSGREARVLASSATIEGYENQVKVLYRRRGRVFPQLGPYSSRSFWAIDSNRLARLFVGVAPRGVTIDFAADRMNECLQRLIREALKDEPGVARASGVDESEIGALVSFYGVDVVYGWRNAQGRWRPRPGSFETQFEPARQHGYPNGPHSPGRGPRRPRKARHARPRLHETDSSGGGIVHALARRGHRPAQRDGNAGSPTGYRRIHSDHIENGRAAPGLVFVLHKIGRERDHKVFRTFEQFVEHADRLVDPVPITRRSRRVLELTFPGLLMGRLLGIHEPVALGKRLAPLTQATSVRDAIARLPLLEADERQAYIGMLEATTELDEGIRADIEEDVRLWFRAARNPATPARFPSELLQREPMLSLRDVEEQVPVYSRGGTR